MSVDGTVFNWMGGAAGPEPVTQTAFSYTSTKSIFTFDVDGKVEMTVTFLSPVYPDDLVRQSLQFSYVDVKVKSSDGSSHSVQVYMDISGGELPSRQHLLLSYLLTVRQSSQVVTPLKSSTGISILRMVSRIIRSILRLRLSSKRLLSKLFGATGFFRLLQMTP